MEKREIVFFTNIPAPYRIELYNYMTEKGFDFEVWYMQSEVSYRPGWKFDANKMRHRYIINYGFFKEFGSHPFFFNPSLIIKAIRKKNLELILAASWNDLDVVIFSFLKRIGLLKANLHYWSEANYLTNGARNDNFLKKIVRKFVYNHHDTIQISSGKMTEVTFEKWGINVRKSVFLPNTIQEEKYILTEELRQMRKSNKIPVILISARLIERLKGIVNFLSALTDPDLKRCKIIIAGSGKDKEMIETYIDNRNIKESVELKGECSVEEMVKLYGMANIFCLPSFADPSPLSVIEALKMELPLLVSNRCGNHFEAVREGVNGYVIDPDDKGQIRESFLSLLEKEREWEAMGRYSLKIYNEIFQKDLAVERFISEFEQSIK